MNLKNTIKTFCCASLLIASTTSCADWLDVKMEDQIMDNTLYAKPEGFKVALNGVYLNMIELYGADLSAGKIDIMAQYYNVTENYNHTYKIYPGYKFDDGDFEYFLDNAWTKAYKLIANLNVLLERCDEENSALTPKLYPIIKGEALALRGMLHLDMLRLFGPVYSDATASQVCIPYQLSSSKDIQPLLPASKVLGHVIDDLEEASELLKEADPIITDGVRNSLQNDNGLDNDYLNYRQLRLNYYAAQALLARAYAWKGDKAQAYQIAKNNIIDQITREELEVFPWTTEAAFHKDGKPDQLFSSEVFFAIYRTDRSTLYSSLFAPGLHSKKSRLTIDGSTTSDRKIAELYDDINDWRLEMWNITEPTKEEMTEAQENKLIASNTLYLTKYQDFDSSVQADGTELYRYMIPLVRLSEVYLLAAEGAPTREEALSYINEIRNHRACRDIVDENQDLQELITKEFAREVIGEGQLYFYYKRHGMEEVYSGTSIEGLKQISPSNYIIQLPKSEKDKRVM